MQDLSAGRWPSILVGGLLAAASLFAGSVSTESAMNLIYNPTSGANVCFQTGTAYANCTGSAAIPGTTSTVSYSGYATATYGRLGTFAQEIVSAGSTASGNLTQGAALAAEAMFSDTYTFNGPSGSGTVTWIMLLSGTEQSSGNVATITCFNVVPGTINFFLACNGTQFGSILISPAWPITFGQPAAFTAGLLSGGRVYDFLNPNVGFTLDYAHTAQLIGFSVTDSDGNPVTRFTVTSGSGATYPAISISPQFLGLGVPGESSCHDDVVSALAQRYGGMNNTASALRFLRVADLQSSIRSFCGN